MNLNRWATPSKKRQHCGTQYRTLPQLLHIDLILLACLIALVVFGFFILYSASNQQTNLVIQEILHIGMGFLLLFFLAQFPPHFYQRWAPLLFAVGVLLLAAVLVIGRIDKGAQRWINLGLFRFQPSELMKIIIPITLAWYFAHQSLPPKIKELSIAGLMVIIPAVLTLKEPDLGTALLLVMSGVCVLLLAGISGRWLFLAAIIVVIALPISWHFLHGYQQQRILTFLNPERDPWGAGYHIIQSKIAIGSGGAFGKGWLKGTQSHLHFLPEHATDFIFAVVGEEFGLFGTLVLLFIYLLITARCFYIAFQSQTTFTRLLAGSLTLMFFLSFLINMGMVCGLLPVVGLPLPLISYGGSSMLSTMASFGILMSIYSHRVLIDQ
ncbi:MAG: rod shape-determining protein RodA [Pseudomonadota bacterium]|nr:rod shape-determining protein RodA [Gammaproteobacteria bacterium]MBU1927128.1 rod shape-determining protein RodA [Gammaproteobacteria bacterium]MBU2545908.1 rod shape-determining protein RodA [Gammaproteobacteria bacterium]